MSVHTFSCLDGPTCGNPVRVGRGASAVAHGRPHARMFAPRGHDVMSGSMLYPPTRDDCDAGILFIEVSGCLPMCGHGAIGTVTMAVENGLVAPATPGVVNLDAPAGKVVARYEQKGRFVAQRRVHK